MNERFSITFNDFTNPPTETPYATLAEAYEALSTTFGMTTWEIYELMKIGWFERSGVKYISVNDLNPI